MPFSRRAACSTTECVYESVVVEVRWPSRSVARDHTHHKTATGRESHLVRLLGALRHTLRTLTGKKDKVWRGSSPAVVRCVGRGVGRTLQLVRPWRSRRDRCRVSPPLGGMRRMGDGAKTEGLAGKQWFTGRRVGELLLAFVSIESRASDGALKVLQ